MATSCWRVPALPGFRSKVDGVATEIAKANALFPAIFVAKGTHHVEFRFISWPFFIGVTLCFLTVWTWIFFSVRRRRWLVSLSALCRLRRWRDSVFLAVPWAFVRNEVPVARASSKGKNAI